MMMSGVNISVKFEMNSTMKPCNSSKNKGYVAYYKEPGFQIYRITEKNQGQSKKAQLID